MRPPRNILLSYVMLFCLSGLMINICVFLFIPSESDFQRLAPGSNLLVLIGLLFIAVAALIGIREVLVLRSNPKRRMIGAMLLLTLLPLIRAFQLYTDLGVLILNGSKHWIALAADTTDPAQGKQYLKVVLSATQYGVNEAENQILTNYSTKTQARLFFWLHDVAPNEVWQKRYLTRAQAAAELSRAGVRK